jgi:hypothetical protein
MLDKITKVEEQKPKGFRRLELLLIAKRLGFIRQPA